jgi:hypothetical protein
MRLQHWLIMLAVLAVGYWLGAMYPAPAKQLGVA